ncbi:MAG: MarR family transcriptional regulator [Candidatus Auribacterota bacterium]|nr:MarR family transcriptional regulator [Candidatus Auribacterota bacterium]
MKNNESNKYISQLNDLLPGLDKYFKLPHSDTFSGIKVTVQQYLALDKLARKGKCMMSDLSSALDIALSTMTELADRLVKKDLITKVRDVKDRRVVWVNFTEKGARVFQELKEKKQENIAAILNKLSQAERKALVGILGIITHTADQP